MWGPAPQLPWLPHAYLNFHQAVSCFQHYPVMAGSAPHQPWLCSGGSVPLADFVGQPVAVGRVETLTAGRDTVPVGCRALGGAGGAVLLTWPCGDRENGKMAPKGFGDSASMATAPHAMGAPAWLCLAHERDACCATGSRTCAWLPPQKTQLPSQKTQPGPSGCPFAKPRAGYQGSVRDNTSKSPLGHQPPLPNMHRFGFPQGGKEDADLCQGAAGGGKCSREELGKQRAPL